MKRMTARTTLLTLAAFATLAVAAAVPVRAADVFSDKLCPRAAAPVTAYVTLSKNDNATVDSVIAVAREAIHAYELCGNEDLANGVTEGVHYAEIRQAQFYVAIARLERLSDERDDARRSLQKALDLTKEPIEWTNSAQNVFRSNNVSVGSGSTRGGAIQPSIYHDVGVAIRDAVKVELDALAASSTQAPGTPTPIPEASAKP